MKKLFFLLPVLIISCSGPTNNEPPPEENIEDQTYTLSTEVSPTEGGNITPEEGEYDEGSEVEVTVESNKGWEFTGWDGDITSDDSSTTILMDNDKSITATFTQVKYPLTVETEGEGTVKENIVEQSTKTDYDHGTVVELTAEPEEDWIFARWEGSLSGRKNPATITVNRPYNITAVFEEKYKEIGKSYLAPNGLTVTIDSLEKEVEEIGLFDYYTIYCTVENTTDDYVFEGMFKMYYSNDGKEGDTLPENVISYEDLKPGETIDRELIYYVKKENSDSYHTIGYLHEGFNANTPPDGALLWKVDE